MSALNRTFSLFSFHKIQTPDFCQQTYIVATILETYHMASSEQTLKPESVWLSIFSSICVRLHYHILKRIRQRIPKDVLR
jgi:hypothetical protein